MKNLIERIKEFAKRNKTYILLVLGLVVVISLIILAFWQSNSKTTNPGQGTIDESAITPLAPPDDNDSGQTISVTNYNDYVENLPSSEQVAINSVLVSTIKMNLGDQLMPAVNAIVRDGTYSQRIYDIEKEIILTSFMVDIPELRQSYRVENYYSPLPLEVSGLVDYATVVLCPTDDEIIYETFDCMDRIRQEQGGW